MTARRPIVEDAGFLKKYRSSDSLDLTGTDSFITITEHSSAPATPAAGTVQLYTKANGFWYEIRDDGIELSVGLPFPQIKTTIETGETVTVLDDFQMLFYGSYVLDGTLVNNGTVVIL